jgi:hypothetical protein
MSVRELRCPKCGASISPDRNVCDYCKAQYIVVEESKAILFGEYAKCNTFERLQFLKKEIKKEWEKPLETRNVGSIEGKMADLLKACNVCHIKNCPFFNIHFWEIFPTRSLTEEEYEEALRKSINEALGKR